MMRHEAEVSVEGLVQILMTGGMDTTMLITMTMVSLVTRDTIIKYNPTYFN